MNKTKLFVISLFLVSALGLEYFGFLKNPQIFGLFLDVIGAYFLAQSFITKKLEDIVSEAFGNSSKNYLGGTSENFAVSLYQQSGEAITGFLILTSGFIFQGIGVLHPEFLLPPWVGASVVIIGLVAIIGIHKKLFNYERASRRIEKADKEMSKKGYI